MVAKACSERRGLEERNIVRIIGEDLPGKTCSTLETCALHGLAGVQDLRMTRGWIDWPVHLAVLSPGGRNSETPMAAREPLFVGVVEKPRLHLVGVEAVEEASVDAHPAKILAQSGPVGQTSTARAMVNSDHLIAPDICLRLTGHFHLFGPVISNQPVELAA